MAVGRKVHLDQASLLDWLEQQGAASPENDNTAPVTRTLLKLREPIVDGVGMSTASIIRNLKGKHKSGAQKADMTAQLEYMEKKLHSHARVMYGDDGAAVLMAKLYGKLDAPAPDWLMPHLFECRYAIQAVFHGKSLADPDERLPDTNVYGDEESDE